METINQARQYNKARHHVFSTYHKEYYLAHALYNLNIYNGKLPNKAFLGLKAELLFYDKYRKELKLTVSEDSGDKADFSGVENGRAIRIDVTTNISYKNLRKYCLPIKESEIDYYLYEIDRTDGKVIERVKLNTPYEDEGKFLSPVVDLAVLHKPDYDKDGCCKYNPYQHLFRYAVDSDVITEEKIATDWYIEDFGTFESNLYDDCRDWIELDMDTDEGINFQEEIERYGREIVRFLTREYDYYILGLMSYKCMTLTPDGDGEYGYYFRWLHPLMKHLGYKVDEELLIDI